MEIQITPYQHNRVLIYAQKLESSLLILIYAGKLKSVLVGSLIIFSAHTIRNLVDFFISENIAYVGYLFMCCTMGTRRHSQTTTLFLWNCPKFLKNEEHWQYENTPIKVTFFIFGILRYSTTIESLRIYKSWILFQFKMQLCLFFFKLIVKVDSIILNHKYQLTNYNELLQL